MTYSLAVKGARANQVQQTKTLTVDDTVALPGGMALAMRLGTPFLCKRSDGSSAYYTYDAERSTPDNPILKAV